MLIHYWIKKRLIMKNIVQLYQVIENPNNDKLYLVLEQTDGSQLLSIKNKNIDTIWKLFRDFMLGLEQLHNFAHMDKPENLLLNQELRLKIADFGVSQIMDDDLVEKIRNISILTSKSKPIDVWAAGFTLYQLFCNEHTFISQREDQLKNNIITKNIQWTEISDLLKIMLDKTNNRITTQQAFRTSTGNQNARYSLKNEYQGNFCVTENDYIMSSQDCLSILQLELQINLNGNQINLFNDQIKVRLKNHDIYNINFINLHFFSNLSQEIYSNYYKFQYQNHNQQLYMSSNNLQ